MILITKAEADKIRERYPDIKLIRTCVQKSDRHHYYLPEYDKCLKAIRKTNVFADRLLKEKEKLYPNKRNRNKKRR